MGISAVFDAKKTIDKAKLWDELKSELEAEASHNWDVTRNGGRVYTVGDKAASKIARSILDRMEQAETFARVRQTST